MSIGAIRNPVEPRAVLELLKPVTWFPPMWAFACGAISAGPEINRNLIPFCSGLVLAGPLVCAASQAINDWYDRDVDAINEPLRPIPSGRVPGSWGLAIAILWTTLSAALSLLLGPTVVAATWLGLVIAWAYSAPPIRLKRNGWIGNAACAGCYEGLAWITGASVMLAGAMPNGQILLLAALYSVGSHGIMTLNDFKSIDGDRQMNVKSLPVLLGANKAGVVACGFMAISQAFVVACLWIWQRPAAAATVTILVLLQILLMRHLLEKPAERAPWYNGTGVVLFVIGMMVAAYAIRIH